MNKNTTLAQDIAEKIYSEIRKNEEFVPGGQLPGELILSKKYNVSRNTLREAIRILASQGILNVYRGKGTYISEDTARFSRDELTVISSQKKRLQEMMEARLIIEPSLASLAASRATEEEIEEILSLERQVRELIIKGENRAEKDQAFHLAIMRAAHNSFMSDLVPIINNSVFEIISSGLYQNPLAEITLSDHALIAEFIKARDPAGAEKAMYIHLKRAMLVLN